MTNPLLRSAMDFGLAVLCLTVAALTLVALTSLTRYRTSHFVTNLGWFVLIVFVPGGGAALWFIARRIAARREKEHQTASTLR
ncbi:PLDc N-terminal domain-containing protein [Microbacterium trichothecenolyticum]|uniref:Cardiolipin synthase N-terminal domain-containing protein n=1 Tax=Microbacterium trichothecenolyticum TaxID=69370 RepID=A0ABU0TQK8_MICTR|nr:PLDc N-terminal domain-containing protein [Microbacterium trichothecenolyticum]MDQ1121725.1 hypothetical protein [Microbacterium trichothecenolyticum]